ncbi:hypothetical protein JJD41_15420 [Oxynema sp. CENA135]|nr:hypothetical protein [Oxynema sp. CENA135]
MAANLLLESPRSAPGASGCSRRSRALASILGDLLSLLTRPPAIARRPQPTTPQSICGIVRVGMII